MTDAISQYAQLAPLDRYAPKAGEKSPKPDAPSAAGETIVASLAGSKAVVPAPMAAAHRTSEAFNLTKLIERVKQEPDFDRAKVEAIRESIRNGQYPLDVYRMAESFVAIEQLIGN